MELEVGKAPIGESTREKPMKEKPRMNSRPWPKIENVVEFESLKDALSENVIVSEKLDGSNLSVSSDSIVASRRVEIARKGENLQDINFGGQSLKNIEKVINGAEAIKRSLSFLDKGAIVTVYGEFLISGTATSKSDKFNYIPRGYQPGHFYAFGLGIHNCSDFAQVKHDLIQREFILMETPCNTECIVALNSKLHELLSKNGIWTIPYMEMDLISVFTQIKDLLLKDEIEGVVININGKSVKWKSREIHSKSRLEKLEKICKDLSGSKFEFVSEILSNVANFQSNLKAKISTAFESAMSKFPQFQETNLILVNFRFKLLMK